MLDRSLRDYLRPGFEQEQQQREAEKLGAVLQALNNCHRTLGVINGGEEAFLAQQNIQEAYRYCQNILQYKRIALQPTTTPTVIDVDSDDFDENDPFV